MAKNPLSISLATSAYSTITVQTVCRTVTLFEDAGGQTTTFKYRRSSADDAATIAAGDSLTLTHPSGFWLPNDVLGEIEAGTTAATFMQLEN